MRLVMRRQLLHGQPVVPPSPRRIVAVVRPFVARIPILHHAILPVPSAAVTAVLVPAPTQSAAIRVVAQADTLAAAAVLVRNHHPKVDASLVSKLCK